MLTKIVDGVEVLCTEDEEAAIRAAWAAEDAKQSLLGYHTLRSASYPDLATQLDMIYHDRLSGTTTWIDAIQAVKDKYPKPTS